MIRDTKKMKFINAVVGILRDKQDGIDSDDLRLAIRNADAELVKSYDFFLNLLQRRGVLVRSKAGILTLTQIGREASEKELNRMVRYENYYKPVAKRRRSRRTQYRHSRKRRQTFYASVVSVTHLYGLGVIEADDAIGAIRRLQTIYGEESEA